MLYAYYVTLETRHHILTDDYGPCAGQMSNALYSTLGDFAKLQSLTKCPTLTDARVEVEISQTDPSPDSSPIAARAVVRATAPDKMSFDKNMFTKMVRDVLPIPVKITKQAVPQEDLAPSFLSDVPAEQPA